MKKSIKIIICLLLAVLVIGTFCGTYISNLNKYVFSTEICTLLFQKSPEEFCEQKGKNTLIEDNYIYSKVDKNDNLILFLTNSQKERWIDLVFSDEMFILFRHAGDVEISDNYTRCTIKCYKETALDNATSFISNALTCLFIQAIDGKESELISLDCYFVDAVTNEVKYHVVLPDKELKFSIDPNVFSSRIIRG